MWLKRYLKTQVERSLAELCHAVLRKDLQMLPFPVLTTRCSSIPGGPCFWPVSLCFSFSSGRFSSLSCSASSNSSSPWLLGSSAGFTSSTAAFCNFQKRMLNMHFIKLFQLKAPPAWAVLEPTPYPVKPAGPSPKPSGATRPNPSPCRSVSSWEQKCVSTERRAAAWGSVCWNTHCSWWLISQRLLNSSCLLPIWQLAMLDNTRWKKIKSLNAHGSKELMGSFSTGLLCNIDLLYV